MANDPAAARGMMSRRRVLDLFENGRRLGALIRTSSGLSLEYAPEWLGWSEATPVSLSLPLGSAPHRGEPVLRFLDNLLPDSEGMRARLASRVDAPDTHPFTLLEILGRCSAGALTFVSEGEAPGAPGKVSGQPLSDAEVGKLLSQLDRRPLGVGPRFRISLAGAQQKTALLFRDGRPHLPLGFTPTTHILKPPMGRVMGVDFSQSVENEFLCLKLAAAFGLTVAEARIADFAGTRALLVERFDRQWTEGERLFRIPHEDCAQALSVPTRRKYELDGGPGFGALLGLLEGSSQPDADRRSFLRAQIFFWLLAAVDGHAKNYSIRLLPGGGFRLAPLYDIVSAEPALSSGELPPEEAAMSLAVGNAAVRRPDRIEPEHFFETARTAGIPARMVRALFEELVETCSEAFDAVREQLPENFPAELASAIFAGVRSRLDHH